MDPLHSPPHARHAQRGYFTEPHALHVMRQLLDVLAFMHKRGVIHRDIKPENILLEKSDPSASTEEAYWDIKVSDFGVVKIFSDQASLATSVHGGRAFAGMEATPPFGAQRSFGHSSSSFTLFDLVAEHHAPQTDRSSSLVGATRPPAAAMLDRCVSRVGSPYYRAPEQVFCYPPYPTTYGPGVDIWSAGVVAYVLLAGAFPFEDRDIPPPPIEAGPGGPRPCADVSGRASRPISIASGRAVGASSGGHQDMTQHHSSLPKEDPLSKSYYGGFDTAHLSNYSQGSFPEQGQHGGQRQAQAADVKPFHSFPQAQWAMVSYEAKDLINHMLEVNPKKRPTAAELLKHRWLQPEAAPKMSRRHELSAGDAKSLSSSYMEGMRMLVATSKRARDLEREFLDGLKGSFDGGSSFGSLTGSGSFSLLRNAKRLDVGANARPQQVGFKAPEGKTSLLPDLAEGSEGYNPGEPPVNSHADAISLLLAAEALNDEMEQHDSKYMKKFVPQ